MQRFDKRLAIVLFSLGSVATIATIALAKNSTASAEKSAFATAESGAQVSQNAPRPQMQPSGMPSGMHHGMPGGMHDGMHVSNEFEFISGMIPHHQEAIDTARLILAKSTRPEMKQFANAIITAQSAEIGQMQTWLKNWYPGQTNPKPYQPMMRPLETLAGDALDRQFLQDMIGHHQGAVMMAKMLQNGKLSQRPEVNQLAQNIVSSQTAEIAQMQTWLKTWFGNAPAGRQPGQQNCHMMSDGSQMCGPM